MNVFTTPTPSAGPRRITCLQVLDDASAVGRVRVERVRVVAEAGDRHAVDLRPASRTRSACVVREVRHVQVVTPAYRRLGLARRPAHQFDAGEPLVGGERQDLFQRQVGQDGADETELHRVLSRHGTARTEALDDCSPAGNRVGTDNDAGPESTGGVWETREAPETWEAWEARNARLLARVGLVLLVFGVFWRLFRYAMALPIWGDEAMLLVNYQVRDYADLFGPIDYCQIAPLLFHVAEMTVVQLLGTSEWAVRLPPQLGSLVGLGLFWLLARLTLRPTARVLAVGVLAVAIWPATTGSLTKPYSWDMLFGTAFLIPLAAWLNDRTRRWPLAVLCTLAPVGLTGSYPAVFVAGGVWVALARPVWRGQDRWQQVLLLLYGLLVAGTFLAHYEFVGKAHLASATYGISTQDGMNSYWAKANAFPPTDPLKLLFWIPTTFLGEIFAYPIGGQPG